MTYLLYNLAQPLQDLRERAIGTVKYASRHGPSHSLARLPDFNLVLINRVLEFLHDGIFLLHLPLAVLLDGAHQRADLRSLLRLTISYKLPNALERIRCFLEHNRDRVHVGRWHLGEAARRQIPSKRR